MQRQDDNYKKLRSYVSDLHEKNKRRVKISGIILIILPVVLGLIRWMTDSDKFAFLILWLICMFAISAYLVSVEYLDYVLSKKLKEFTGSNEGGEE